jgi:hypothetical protein
MARSKTSKPGMRVERVRRVPARASDTQAVSSAAERLGAGDEGTMPSSDWMAERGAAAPAQPEGTPVTSRKRDAARSGRARESRRGSY